MKWSTYSGCLNAGVLYQPGSQTLYKVHVRAYSRKENAENMVKKLKSAGFDAKILS